MTANQIAYWKHLEDKRHNLVMEGIDRDKVSIEQQKADENARHNLVTENISWGGYQESVRSNIARENENRRSNMAHEGLTAWNISETVRHNQAGEYETHRTNVEYESIANNEQTRKWEQTNLDWYTLEDRERQTDLREEELRHKKRQETSSEIRNWSNLILNNLNPMNIFSKSKE